MHLRHSLFHLLNCLITTASELREQNFEIVEKKKSFPWVEGVITKMRYSKGKFSPWKLEMIKMST